jgi:hypothetical protein
MLVKKALKLVTVMSLMLTMSVLQMFAATIGNATIARTFTDTYHNFTIIDTNNSVLVNGEITSFSYYAANTNNFSFVVVDSANVVEYVSPLITPAATGVQIYTPVAPIAVTVGDNIGMYFESTLSHKSTNFTLIIPPIILFPYIFITTPLHLHNLHNVFNRILPYYQPFTLYKSYYSSS